MKQLLILASIALFPFTTYSQNLIGDHAEIEVILANIKTFSDDVMASDYQAIGNAYTKDAKIFPSSTDIIEGRDAIVKYWTPSNGSKISYHKITPEEIKINGDEAYDYGRYEGTTQSSNGTKNSWKGKYVIIWRKVNGQWKIYLDIWNRIGE